MDNDFLVHIHVETPCNVKTETVALVFNTLMFTSRSGYLQNGEKRQINLCLPRKNEDARPDLL